MRVGRWHPESSNSVRSGDLEPQTGKALPRSASPPTFPRADAATSLIAEIHAVDREEQADVADAMSWGSLVTWLPTVPRGTTTLIAR